MDNQTMAPAPTAGQERISELDVIRGFALFGVVWMNIFGMGAQVVPPDVLKALPTAEIDAVVSNLSRWFMLGKAQALFSMLFGFGFAIFYERAAARGADATRLYARRLAILFVLGLFNWWFLFFGDILHMYALMGFVLLLTRRWPSWLLVTLGVALCLFTLPFELGVQSLYGGTPPWDAQFARAQEVRWEVLRGSDLPAFVAANIRTVWWEFYAQPLGVGVLGLILGRFLVGSWIHRCGWLQDPGAHVAGFRRWAPILLVSGLALAGVRPILRFVGPLEGPLEVATRPLADAGMLVLALGYAATLVVICQTTRGRQLLSGLGAVGRMALTNYLMQSLLYVLLLFGFGLGLLPYIGATNALGLAVLIFALQIPFSRWWLARYRFGPMEWLWRSGTYGRWQPMRREDRGAALAAAE